MRDQSQTDSANPTGAKAPEAELRLLAAALARQAARALFKAAIGTPSNQSSQVGTAALVTGEAHKQGAAP